VSPPPPPIPARSQAPKAAKSPKEERIDSGRESDDFAAANDSSFDESKMKKNFKEFLRDNMSSYATSAAATGGSSIVRRVPPFSTSASVLSVGSNGDEGFSSSHEDQSSLSLAHLGIEASLVIFRVCPGLRVNLRDLHLHVCLLSLRC